MTHLSEEELVDLIDGALADQRRAHLRDCRACQGQAEALGALLARVTEVAVPEPSPLFWDHLSRRVADAVATPEPAGGAWLGWLARPASAWAAGLASLALVAALSWSARPGSGPEPGTAPVPPVSVQQAEVAGSSDPDDIEADEAWALVRSVADEVGWDDAHAAGLSARPGAAERMALELSSREQSELALLIEAELKRPGV